MERWVVIHTFTRIRFRLMETIDTGTIEAGGSGLIKIFFLVIGAITAGVSMTEIDLFFTILLKGISILSFTAAFILSCLTIYHKYIKGK